MTRVSSVYLALFGAVVVISFASILIKLADAPALIIAAYRLGIASLILVPLAVTTRRGELRQLSPGDWGLSLLSGAFLSAHFVAWIASLKYTSVASSVVLVATNPIFVGLGTVLFLRERLHPLLVAGIFVSTLGGIVIGWDDFRLGGQALYGDLLALLGAVAHSGYLLIGRRVRQHTSAIGYITLVYGTAAVLTVGSALLVGLPWTGYSAQTYAMIALLALGPQLLGHTAYNWALRYISAAVVAVVILAEPVGATALAYALLGESVTPRKVAGGLLTLLGVYLAVRSGRPASRAEASG